MWSWLVRLVTACYGTVSATNQTSTIGGYSSTDATLSITIGQQQVSCGAATTEPAGDGILDDQFTSPSVIATLTVKKDTTTVGFKVCYSATTDFEDLQGDEVLSGDLPLCKSVSDQAPCVESQKVSSGKLVADLSLLPGDPRFWAPPLLSSFSPSSGVVGTKVIIKGEPLKGTRAVEFNGVPTQFTVNSAGTSITALYRSKQRRDR